MTKVTILGQVEPKKKKKIKFCVHINATITNSNETRCTKNSAYTKPNCWDNVVLIHKDESEEYYDLMYAYDNDGITCALFLGHFNDGIV